MNPNLPRLQPYPFEKLAKLKQATTPDTSKAHIALSIGEPKHAPPGFVVETLAKHLNAVSHYAATKGLPELRQAIQSWATQRFKLDQLDPETEILPVNGTREALFAFAQTVISPSERAKVFMPNPFYQIYEGASLLAGAEPVFLNCTEDQQFLPDYAQISESEWEDCQLLYLCTPGNPTGSVYSIEQLQALIRLADKHKFIIASDECYSELYFDEEAPPPGLLEACAAMGRHDFARCVVFHSLSKRSNLPGLRSGFVAGDATLISDFLKYRTYHGCAMPLHTQHASIAAWSDEKHVAENRAAYREKFDRVLDILSPVLEVSRPDAGFYLWPKLPIDDQVFARDLFEREHVTVLPGTFLARDTESGNPGAGRIRMALVAELNECIEAAERIVHFIRHAS